MITFRESKKMAQSDINIGSNKFNALKMWRVATLTLNHFKVAIATHLPLQEFTLSGNELPFSESEK